MSGLPWLDRAIGAVAPRTALKRVLARQSFEAIARGYDGAAQGRRTGGWRTSATSADAEVAIAGALLRDRMRDHVRNNPHAAKAVSALVNNIIGSGIIARAASGNEKLDAQVNALWEAWSARCDADGQLDFLGLQTLACRQMIEAGEVLLRRRPRRLNDGLDVPKNISIIALPPKCPELNPVENVWQFMRDNWLSNRVFTSHDNIVDHCCEAWNRLVEQPWRIMSIGRRQWAPGS